MPLAQRIDGVFSPIATPELRGHDLPLLSDLADHMSCFYEEDIALIDIDGQRYEGNVLKPKDGLDHWYVVVDSSYRPIHATTCTKELTQSELAVLNSGISVIDQSEALSPQESVSIPDSFIEPEFQELANDGDSCSRLSWSNLLEMSRVVIIGAPGAGKTTALRRLAHAYLERWQKDSSSKFPVYIQMRHLHDGGGVEQVMMSNLAEYNDDFRMGTSLKFSDQNLVLLLDGVDEVPDTIRDNALEAIAAFSHRNASLNIIVSTRESGFRWNLPSFRYLRLLPFSSNKIREWSYYRFGMEAKSAWKDFVTSLEERDSLHELAGNPLFLSLAVSLYRRNSALPQSRASLLRSYVLAMTEQWDSVRGVVRQRESWAAPPRKVAALCYAAYMTRTTSRETFSKSDFENWNKSLDIRPSLLSACERDTGIVIEVAPDIWCFSHRTFADFLAAQFIVEHTSQSANYLDPLVKAGNWFDVWAYSCGISQDATELLQFVLTSRTIQKDRKIDALAAALEQDILVPKSVVAKSLSFIAREAMRILSHAVLTRSKGKSMAKNTWHLTSNSSKVSLTQIESVSRAIVRLRKSKIGPLLADRLHNVQSDSAKLMATFLEAESLASVTRAEEGSPDAVTMSLSDELGHVGNQSE